MEPLREWVRNIVLVILFANFIQMLVPSGQMKRFVKVIIGFFIILVVLNPILSLARYPQQILSLELSNIQRPSFEEVVEDGESLRRDQNEQVKGEYKQRLSKQIESFIEFNFQIKPTVELTLDQENELEQVVIKGRKAGVTPVNVDLSEDDKEPKFDQKEESMEELIANFYGLNLDQVEVKLD
ncbi:stage III sporulation protein AF [Natroniella sulfidigena]|uniref:stage III sporulation protein AF n=1 Tax=Natroniella sulfidigena TaxID=723921 RepID=UPI00200AAB23|nr:stage III sporulation protein AF [Natroniella sulfidigena]MCK8817503.1 stage III sporulation protein AF [Natroniella sulfidigena]